MELSLNQTTFRLSFWSLAFFVYFKRLPKRVRKRMFLNTDLTQCHKFLNQPLLNHYFKSRLSVNAYVLQTLAFYHHLASDALAPQSVIHWDKKVPTHSPFLRKILMILNIFRKKHLELRNGEITFWLIFFIHFSGQSMIVELIAHSCQLHKDQFDATDDEAADRLIHCANAALPYFSVSNLT